MMRLSTTLAVLKPRQGECLWHLGKAQGTICAFQFGGKCEVNLRNELSTRGSGSTFYISFLNGSREKTNNE